jgi:hypothetical protein
MSRCPGLHCPGCGDSGGWWIVGGVVAAGAVVYAARHFIELVVRFAALTVLGLAVLAASVAVIVWMARRGGDVATVSHGALPAPERPALTARPAREVPAAVQPQQITNNFYGYRPADVARAVAEQQALTERNER